MRHWDLYYHMVPDGAICNEDSACSSNCNHPANLSVNRPTNQSISNPKASASASARAVNLFRNGDAGAHAKELSPAPVIWKARSLMGDSARIVGKVNAKRHGKP